MNHEYLTIENQNGKNALGYTQQFFNFSRQLGEESHVLDLCCGYGRPALYLCERRISVTACDANKTIIEELEPFTYVGGRENEEDVPHHYVDISEICVLR